MHGCAYKFFGYGFFIVFLLFPFSSASAAKIKATATARIVQSESLGEAQAVRIQPNKQGFQVQKGIVVISGMPQGAISITLDRDSGYALRNHTGVMPSFGRSGFLELQVVPQQEPIKDFNARGVYRVTVSYQ